MNSFINYKLLLEKYMYHWKVVLTSITNFKKSLIMIMWKQSFLLVFY